MRVCQKPQIFTLELTKSVISSIKWALLVHVLFSFFMYTTPNILSSAPQEDALLPVEREEPSADSSGYLERFSEAGLSHLHVAISAFASPALILVLCLEELLTGALHSMAKSCRKCCKSRRVRTGPKHAANYGDIVPEGATNNRLKAAEMRRNSSGGDDPDDDDDVAVRKKGPHSVVGSKTVPMFEGGDAEAQN